MNLQVHRLILTWLAAVAVGCHTVDETPAFAHPAVAAMARERIDTLLKGCMTIKSLGSILALAGEMI
jgi:hypothetical protein